MKRNGCIQDTFWKHLELKGEEKSKHDFYVGFWPKQLEGW